MAYTLKYIDQEGKSQVMTLDPNLSDEGQKVNLQHWVDTHQDQVKGYDIVPSESPNLGVQRYTGSDAIKSYYSGLDTTPPTATEEATIREQKRNDVQSQIDVINQKYAQLISGEQTAGEDRYARARALMSSAGLLGTPMGATAKETTRQYTQKNITELEKSQAGDVANILAGADVRADEEIKLQGEEATKNAEAYVSYLKDKQAEIKDTWSGLAKSGITLERVKANQSYYDQAREEMNMDNFQFDLWYQSQMPPAAQPTFSEIQYEKNGSTWLKRIAFDPKTGQKTEYDYDLGIPYKSGEAGYDTKVLDDGTVLLLPKTFDKNKPIQDQIIQYGAKGEFAKAKEPTDQDKEITNFRNDASNYILQMSKSQINWAGAWSALHTKYPNASIELIDQTLGLDNRTKYDKSLKDLKDEITSSGSIPGLENFGTTSSTK